MTDEFETLAKEAEAEDVKETPGEFVPGPGDQQKPPPEINTGEIIGGLLMITFNELLASKRGAHWKLDPGEGKALGQSYGDVIDKYFPDFNSGPELTAVAISLAVVGPRLMMDRQAANDDNVKGGEDGEESKGKQEE